MIKPEEKLKLMLELGLEEAAVKYAEAHNLTALKFRPISGEKIEELLSVEYKEKMSFQYDDVLGCVFIGGVFSAMCAVASNSWFSLLVLVASVAVGCYLGRPKVVTEEAIVCDMPLADWENNLPYGALLSVKEAKQQGFKNFTIYFPAKQGSRYGVMQRLKNDPIIVAQKKGSNKLYNIFAWDDGKLYE